ncbi:MAG: hypothetical protein CMD65_03760 [Gammaproteobacteria bacterium]|nr:hypothetical protein [Gammaproteobacteria bacterium]
MKNKCLVFLTLTFVSFPAYAGWIPDEWIPDDLIPDISLPQKPMMEILDSGIELIPKTYRIPIDQGLLIRQEKLDRLQPGLTKEQVKFLMGTPTFIDPFHNNRWDYIFYTVEKNKVNKTKRLIIYFKNEIVYAIHDQKKVVRKEGLSSNAKFADAPVIEKIPTEQKVSVPEIVIARREDYLSYKKTRGLPVCIDNELETYESERTLVNADSDTLEIRSDKQSQDDKGIYYASGKVQIERSDDLIKADEAQYNADTGVLTAKDNVTYLNKDITINAIKGGYNSQTNTVSFNKATYNFVSQDRPGSGRSSSIFVDEKEVIHLTPATYTTCNINDPDWELDASKTELYRDIDRGHAYNLVLKYKNLPILYTPFISFPLTDKRQTGFLFPRIGNSQDSGVILSAPYYFNLAPNYDLTFIPTNYSGRGKMYEFQTRHKSKSSSTEIQLATLKDDDIKKDDRHAFFIKDDRVFLNNMRLENNAWYGTRITSKIDAGGVSDKTYFDDFSSSVAGIGRSHILREVRLNRTDRGDFGELNMELLSQGYQVAKSGLIEQYKTMPKFTVNYKSMKKNYDFGYNFNAEYAAFRHTLPTQSEGSRYTIYPSVDYLINEPGWMVRPKIGFQYTKYELSNTEPETRTRHTAIASLYGKMVLEKRLKNNILQTLEPQLYLLYIPVGQQDDIPLFDTGLNDFKYTLFSENKFYGNDRLNDAKQMTLALTSRIINSSTGIEMINGTIGQIFYFDDRDVHLTKDTKKHSDASNMLGIINARLSDNWRLSGETIFNPHAGYGEKNAVRLMYKDTSLGSQRIFNASYRFNRGSQEEIDLSGVVPINNRLSFVGKYNYSFNNERSDTEDLLESMLGFEYESCCYGFKFVVRDYWDGNKSDNAFYFEFLPKGLATSNNQTSQLLKRGILGYQDVYDY